MAHLVVKTIAMLGRSRRTEVGIRGATGLPTVLLITVVPEVLVTSRTPCVWKTEFTFTARVRWGILLTSLKNCVPVRTADLPSLITRAGVANILLGLPKLTRLPPLTFSIRRLTLFSRLTSVLQVVYLVVGLVVAL